MSNTAQLMQAEAWLVLDFFKKRDIRVNIMGGYPTPGFHVYQMVMDSMQRFAKLEEMLDDLQSYVYADRVKRRLIDANDPDIRVVCRAQAQPLVLEINRPVIETLYIEDVEWQAHEFVSLAGVSYLTRAGQVLTWNLTDPSQPHALVAGSTGSGKSNLLLNIALTLALGTGPHKLSYHVVDGGNSTLLELGKLPHTVTLATDGDGALAVVANLKALVLDRKAKRMDKPTTRHLLIMDELANLMAVLDAGEAKALQRDLAMIAAEGRKFGVHMLVCTQKPLAEVTGSLTKTNMAVRFVGSMASKIDANTAAGAAGTGAERLAGKGDFMRVVGGHVRRFQVPMVHNPGAIVRKICAAWREVAPAPRLRVSSDFGDLTRVVEPLRQGEHPLEVSAKVDAPVVEQVPVVQGRRGQEMIALAETIRPLWLAGKSKNEMARFALQQPYAGGFRVKIDRALEILVQGTQLLS